MTVRLPQRVLPSLFGSQRVAPHKHHSPGLLIFRADEASQPDDLMNTTELARRLEAEGANPDNYDIGWRGYNGFCLLHAGGQWQVLFSERGQDQPPIFTSADEAAACEYYLHLILAQPQYHPVGFFRAEKTAQALQAQLEQHGLAVRTGSLLYTATEYRYQVWVMGKDIFAARRLLGDKLPLRDDDEARPGLLAQLRHWLS